MGGMRMRGLLWKEWRQYRGYFLLAFLFISKDTILVPISAWVYQVGDSADAWSAGIKNILATGFSTTETTAVIMVVLLAALMLAGERTGTLNYLVTTPVSRQEIIRAKLLSGCLVIISIMSVISGFLLLAGALLPAQYSAEEVINWVVITTAALLCLFSLALLVASFSRGILSSALITMVIMVLPWMLISMVLQIFRQFYTLSAGIELKARYIATYLYIPDYISRDGRYIRSSNLAIDRVAPDYPLEVAILLLAAFLFLWVAIKAFEKNSLEHRDELLLFGNFKQIGLILISLMAAMGWAAQMAASPVLFLFYFIAMWLGLYLAMFAVISAITWLSLRRG